MNNFQSQFTLDQSIYDAGQTRHAVRSAELARQMTGEETRRAEMDVIAAVARAYYGAVLAGESLTTAREALRSAEADLKRADAVRTSGACPPTVDVLSIRVHLAAVEEQRIQRASDLDVARAALKRRAWPAPRYAPTIWPPRWRPLDLPEIEVADYAEEGGREPSGNAPGQLGRVARAGGG